MDSNISRQDTLKDKYGIVCYTLQNQKNLFFLPGKNNTFDGIPCERVMFDTVVIQYYSLSQPNRIMKTSSRSIKMMFVPSILRIRELTNPRDSNHSNCAFQN